MEILSVLAVIAEILFILILIFAVIKKKNRYSAIKGGSAKVRKIAASALAIIIVALGAEIGEFFSAQSNINRHINRHTVQHITVRLTMIREIFTNLT